MNTRTNNGFMLAALLFVGTAHAGNIYVCKGAHGVNSYQNTPCPTPVTQIRHETYDDALARPGIPSPAPVSYAAGVSVRAVSPGGAPLITAPVRLPRAISTTGGLGSSAYQRGEIQGTRCVNANGQVYYTAAACRTSTTTQTQWEPHDWHHDTVQGMPGAPMVGPNQAVDPYNGRVVNLQPTRGDDSVEVQHTTQDQGVPMDADAACAGAQRAAKEHPFSGSAQRDVEALCRRGRSLYDTQPSANSLYGSGH